MPVQLPLQPAGVILPAQPQNPPTLADVVRAKHYQSQVDVAVALQVPNGPTANDAARADIYKATVITAHSAIAVAPAWFQPALNIGLAPIRQTIGQIRNLLLYDGSAGDFTIVPFNDGSMPPAAPHNLPPLVNAAAIRALTGPQSTAYANGYGLGHIVGAPARRAAIGRVVGCRVAKVRFSPVLDLVGPNREPNC